MGVIAGLNEGVTNAQEFNTLDAGQHQLQIANAKVKKSKKGHPYISVCLESIADPMTNEVWHTLFLPSADSTEKQIARTYAAIKAFDLAFDIDPSVDLEFEDDGNGGIPDDGGEIFAWKGQTGWAVLKHKEDPERGTQAVVASFVRV